MAPLVGIGPPRDLVEVVTDDAPARGCARARPRRAPRSRGAPGQPTGAPDPTASSPAERALACHSARSRLAGANLHPNGASRAHDAPLATSGGPEGARPPASLRRGRTECGPKEYAGSPALGLSRVRQARRRHVRDPAAAAADAVAEHPRERSGEPVQRASRSAADGGMEAPRCRAVHVPAKPERRLIPASARVGGTGISSAAWWINMNYASPPAFRLV